MKLYHAQWAVPTVSHGVPKVHRPLVIHNNACDLRITEYEFWGSFTKL